MLHECTVNKSKAATTGRLYSVASWERPSTYWTVVVCHLPLALLAAAALLLPYGVTLQGLPQSPCTFLYLTGFPCPFCGFTRAFWAISTGHWGIAFANSPLCFAVYLSAWAVFIWNGAALICAVVLSRGSLLQLDRGKRRAVVAVILTLLAANWIYRISMGFDVA